MESSTSRSPAGVTSTEYGSIPRLLPSNTVSTAYPPSYFTIDLPAAAVAVLAVDLSDHSFFATAVAVLVRSPPRTFAGYEDAADAEPEALSRRTATRSAATPLALAADALASIAYSRAPLVEQRTKKRAKLGGVAGRWGGLGGV